MQVADADTTGWTGGQYSVIRAMIGAYVAAKLSYLICWNAPVIITGTELVGLLAACSFLVGLRERLAGTISALSLGVLAAQSGFLADPALYGSAALFAAPWLTEGVPYGGLSASGRPDPRGDWFLPTSGVSALLVGLGSLLAGSAIASLTFHASVDPAGLGYAIAAAAAAAALGYATVSPPIRPPAWCLVGFILVANILPPGLDRLRWPMLVALLLAARPAWIPPRHREKPDLLLYDGQCGLCHGAVRFVLSEEQVPGSVRIAALDSSAARSSLSDEERTELPDSSVVVTGDGRILIRAQAVVRTLEGLGGLWRIVGLGLDMVPNRLADRCYDFIAAHRKKIFGSRSNSCPLLPEHLQTRIEA